MGYDRILAFGLPWALLAWPAAPEAKLPECCRRDGKHRCAMQSSDETTAQVVRAAKSRCASYPQTQSTVAAVPFGLAPVPPHMAAPPLALVDAVAQAEAGYRISFARSRHERGPPSLLS